jgi:hypothetical protein
MKILEKGHVYELDQLDKYSELDTKPVILRFVNRETGNEHPGTQTQEVLRALIDRTKHCDSCLRWDGNDQIIFHLRMALVLHEARALQRKVEKGKLESEKVSVDTDGHFHLTMLGEENAKKERKI